MAPYQMRESKVKQGIKHAGTNIIFDIKMGRRVACKYRLVTGGHKKAPPLSVTYSIFVTR